MNRVCKSLSILLGSFTTLFLFAVSASAEQINEDAMLVENNSFLSEAAYDYNYMCFESTNDVEKNTDNKAVDQKSVGESDITDVNDSTTEYNSTGSGQTRMDSDFSLSSITDYYYHYIAGDNNWLNEDVIITCQSLSSNITKIEVKIFEKHTNRSEETILSSGQSTGYFHVSAFNGYYIYVKVYQGNVSTTNPGSVTIHVSDN